MRRLFLIGLFMAAAGYPMARARSSEPAPASTRAASPTSEEAKAVVAIVGTTPPEWQVERWLHSPPLRLADLRGKIVLVRWWTAGCPYCSTSAPALRELDRTYGPRGVVVVGIYHHKETGPFDPAVYEETARKYGFTFPLAFDPDWRTFKSWMHGADSGWTSVTFLLDKEGVVRWFHPGGQYEKGDANYTRLTGTITKLLADQ